MSLRNVPVSQWSDEELCNELRFLLRFEVIGAGHLDAVSFAQIQCEAIARILERTPKLKKKGAR
jgi:hypothetical protein